MINIIAICSLVLVAVVAAIELYIRRRYNAAVRIPEAANTSVGPDVPRPDIIPRKPGLVIYNTLVSLYRILSGQFRNGGMAKGFGEMQGCPGTNESRWFQANSFGMHLIMTWDAMAARKVLFAKEEDMGKLKFSEVQGKLIGESILLVEGDAWKRQKKVLSPAFQWDHIKESMPVFNHVGAELVACWRENGEKVTAPNKQEGRSIEIYPWLQKATLDVIGSAGFGVEFKSLTPDQTSRTKEVAIYEDMMTEFINPVHFIERIDKALGTYNTLVSKVDKYNLFLKGIIEEKREKFLALKKQGEDLTTKAKDILDMLVLSHFDEDGLNDDEMIGNVSTFFIAGHETVAGCMGNTLFLLAQNPSKLRRAQREVDAVFNMLKPGELPTYEQIKEMEFVHACIKESLRMLPPASIVIRDVRRDLECDGYFFQKGTAAAVHVFGMHHNPEYWNEPEQFIPQRFLKPSSPSNSPKTHRRSEEELDAEDDPHDGFVDKKRPAYAFMPFSMGPRQCIGNNFALLQMRVELAVLLRNFDFFEDKRDQKYINHEYSGVVMCPAPGARLMVVPREGVRATTPSIDQEAAC